MKYRFAGLITERKGFIMRMYDLIEKKKTGIELTKTEIDWFIEQYTKDEIPDYQVSAFMMAIYFQGMSKQETSNLTMAMAKSGDVLDLSEIKGIKVDKHSTGGVGDKTSLVVAPMVSALGVPVAKMSGRGLGHTGGTIDKLESFPGFHTSISEETFIHNVNQYKIAIAGQTANLAPADKKLYALRDVTATVDQLALIAGSIMSKKIAAGADAIVLDVKSGTGAFMRNDQAAIELAQTMVDIGNSVGRKTTAVISDMNQPLGLAVGNNLEVIEAINTLKGQGPEDLMEVSLTLGSHMVYLAGIAESIDQGRTMLQQTIEDGTALAQLKKLIAGQGGDSSYVDDPSKFEQAQIIEPVYLDQAGYISHIEAEEIGFATLILGGGRETKDSVIDLTVGFVMANKLGDRVDANTKVATVYGNSQDKVKAAVERFKAAFEVSEQPIEKPALIKAVIE